MFRPWEIEQPNPDFVEVSSEDEEAAEEEVGRKRKHLSEDAKEIIKNVHQSLLEKDCSAPIKVTSDLVKIPYSTVHDIIRNREKKERSYKKFSRISEELGTEIKQVIYDMYKQNVVPTTSNLLLKLQEFGYEVNYSEESFRLYLRSMGYDYKMLNQRLTIMETPRLKKWRWEYISQIRKYRQEGRYIVYLDETWYDTHDMVKKGISDGTNNCCLTSFPSKGKRIIILHAGGTDGWASNALLLSAKNIQHCSADYHSDMDSTLFETWFQQQLIPYLPPNSVIVMDNASYHSKLVDKKPTKATKKQDIIDFMRRSNIDIPEGKITKEILLRIINALEIPRRYRVDEIAKSSGHNVLRLPPYYCVLNPIELVWATLKKSVRRKNTSPSISASVVDLIRREVDNIRSELWKNCVNHVIEIENSYVAPECQEFIINLEESDGEQTDYHY